MVEKTEVIRQRKIKLHNWIASRANPVIKERFSALAMTPDFYLFSILSTHDSHYNIKKQFYQQ